jgi:hypothetical protein
MKTAYTFPSNWERERANQKGSYFEPQIYGFDTTYMTSTENPLHNEAMMDERRRVMSRLQNNKNRDMTFQHNGWAGIAPKAEPQGSFNMPLSLSGSTRYGAVQSLSGGARTDAGQQYVSGLLKKRAQQLEEMKMAEEMGTDMVPSVAPATQTEALETTLDLLVENLIQQFFSGEFQDMRKEDINQVYGRLLEEGRLLSKDKLETYYNQFIEVRETLEQLIASNDRELSQRFVYLLPKNVGLMVFKIAVLLRVIISVKQNYTEAEQQKIIRDLSKMILKAKNREDLMTLEKDIYNRFGQLSPPEIPTIPRADALEEARRISRTTGRRARVRKEAEEALIPADRAQLRRLEVDKNRARERITAIEGRIAILVPQTTGELDQAQRNRLTRRINEEQARLAEAEEQLRNINDEITFIRTRAGDIEPLEEFVYGSGKHKRTVSDKMKKRNALVKRLMSEGMTLGQASKKIKADGLL